MMNDDQLKIIASQLRKPVGDIGRQVGQKMNDGNRYINQWTIDFLNPIDGDRILEVGMGNGFFVKDIVSKANDILYTGSDFSQTMIDEAERVNALLLREGKVKFFLSEASKLPFKSAAFTKVFTVNTLYFWDPPALTLAELGRVLKPDGELIIGIRPKSNMENLPFVKYGFTTYTPDEVVLLLEENGYRVTGCVEKAEPAQELNGQQIIMESLIVKAVKRND